MGVTRGLCVSLIVAVLAVLVLIPPAAEGRDRRGGRRRRGPICLPPGDSNDWASSLGEAVKESETVFTGKVLEMDGDVNGRFRVRLKRVSKGGGWLEGMKEVWIMEGECGGVTGGGERKAKLRVKDTAVFIGERLEGSEEGDFKLMVEPVSLTLRNLDVVNTAAKDMTYKPRSAIMEEPCEKTFCPFGAICESDGGEGRCRCPDEEECPPPLPPPSHALAPAAPPPDSRVLGPPPGHTSTQVCGTDGETYASECLLRVRSCRRPQLRLRIAHNGPCDGSPTGHHRG